MKQHILDAIQPETSLSHNLVITATKIYTDVDGQKIDKNTLPGNLQVSQPVYLLNKFDLDSGYVLARKNTPPVNWSFLRTFIRQSNFDFQQFSGLNDVSTSLSGGDIVLQYVDDPLNPTFFCWVILNAADRPLSGIIKNIGLKAIKSIKIYPPNISDYKEEFSLLRVDDLGNFEFDQISQLAYRYPKLINDSFVTIPLELMLTQFTGFVTLIPFTADVIQYEFEFKNK